jgi:hypothetical protein
LSFLEVKAAVAQRVRTGQILQETAAASAFISCCKNLADRVETPGGGRAAAISIGLDVLSEFLSGEFGL